MVLPYTYGTSRTVLYDGADVEVSLHLPALCPGCADRLSPPARVDAVRPARRAPLFLDGYVVSLKNRRRG